MTLNFFSLFQYGLITAMLLVVLSEFPILSIQTIWDLILLIVLVHPRSRSLSFMILYENIYQPLMISIRAILRGTVSSILFKIYLTMYIGPENEI